MRRGVLPLTNRVLRHLAVPAIVLLLGSGSAFAQSGDNHAQDQGKGRHAARRAAAKENRAQDRRIRRSRPGHQRPGRQPRMRLARPPRGPPDVGGRPRYRLPPSRPLRPLRLPGRTCPGGVPLPDPVRRPDRRQGAAEPGLAFMPAGSTPAPSRRRPRPRPRHLRVRRNCRPGAAPAPAAPAPSARLRRNNRTSKPEHPASFIGQQGTRP